MKSWAALRTPACTQPRAWWWWNTSAAARSRHGTLASMSASQRRTAKKPLAVLSAPSASAPTTSFGTSPTRRRFAGRSSSAASQMEPERWMEGLPSTPATPSAADTSPASAWAAQQRSAVCRETSPRSPASRAAVALVTCEARKRSRHRCVHRNSAGPRTKPCPALSVTAVKSPQRPSFEAVPGPPPGPADPLPSPVRRSAAMSTTESAQRQSARLSAAWSQGQSLASTGLTCLTVQQRLAPLNAQMRDTTSLGSPRSWPGAARVSGSAALPPPAATSSSAEGLGRGERAKKSSSVTDAAGTCNRPRAILFVLPPEEHPVRT
mmetsp:Transcript_55589/g.172244  ORF Transcript_55589/g.172244 Transcript_55589/m.172244 type:complete len:322 (-) Transcript_55589:31-996(-)